MIIYEVAKSKTGLAQKVVASGFNTKKEARKWIKENKDRFNCYLQIRKTVDLSNVRERTGLIRTIENNTEANPNGFIFNGEFYEWSDLSNKELRKIKDKLTNWKGGNK